MTFSCFIFCKSVYPLVLCCKNFHFVLKFQAWYITIKDLLWYVILHNYLLKIPWHLVRNHMISRSRISCSLHVVEAHLFLKYSNLLLLAQQQPFSPQSLQSICIVTRSSPSLQYHLLPTFSVPHLPSHTQKVFSTFLRKGSQQDTQWEHKP